MFRRGFLILILVFFVFGAWANCVQAGFGISPPHIKTEKPIIPGTHYEQKITLLRSSADIDLIATLQIKAPEIEQWISFNNEGKVNSPKGKYQFVLPKGKYQVPLIVKVDVPQDAEVGNYTGHIDIRVSPRNKKNKAGVAIALGARVDIDLNISNEAFPNFIIRSVNVSNVEQLGHPWDWPIFSWFFYRINVKINIENIGNIKTSPTKVHVDVYDLNEKELLESSDDKHLEKVKPFEKKEIVATFPTKLAVGQYWARVKVYKENKIVGSYKQAFSVMPVGHGNGIKKFGYKPWLLLGFFIVILLIILVIFIKIKAWRPINKILYYIIAYPIIFLWKKVSLLLNKLKIKFWRWVHKKASQYQDQDNCKRR